MNQPFVYNPNAMGGTEVVTKWFHENILPYTTKFYQYNCLLIPGYVPPLDELYKTRNIIWLHLLPKQIEGGGSQIIVSKEFIDSIEYLIVGSDFHKRKVLEEMNIDPDKIVVIEYFIDDIPYDENKFNNIDKVKIIHASNPRRGMDILLRSLEYVEEDFELNIYNDFYPELYQEWHWTKYFNDKRINFYGKTPRKTVLKAFSESHIHAYPAFFEETECLAQMESIVAGCYPIYSNVGVLPETSMNFGKICNFSFDHQSDAEKFGKELNKTIIDIKNNKFTNHKEQSLAMSKYHRFERIKDQWMEFHERI